MKHPESIDATPLERLVQPYLDDELAPEEVVAFERRLDDDPGLRDLVHEQAEVRDALRSLPRDAAPPSLRARILLELDAVDREPTVVPLSRRLARRSGALLRGALVMIPASAAALALFFLARQ